jgi:maltose O-acetyltransferase
LSSFKAANAQQMMDHKLNMKRHLKDFNDDSIPDGSTLDSLKVRRQSTAKLFLGKLGKDTNIEAPFFCTFGCNTFIGKNSYANRE